MSRPTPSAPIPPARPVSRARVVVASLALAGAVLAVDLVVPAGATPLSGTAPAEAATPKAPTECLAGWRQMPVPDVSLRSAGFEVLSRKGRPAWILGGSNQGLLALRWDGGAWRRAPTPRSGHTGIVGASLLGARSVLAVGYVRPSVDDAAGALRPISGVMSRARWRRRAVPYPPGTRAALADVATLPRGLAWAVGTRLSGGRARAYALRWDGRRWRRAEPRPGSGSGLTAVERAPGGTVWAVGWKETSRGVPRPYIVRRRDGRWQRVRAPSLPEGQAVLTDVRFRGSRDGVAVGYLVARGADRHEVIALRWNGRAWSRIELPWAEGAPAVPRSLALGPQGDLWIVGTQTANAEREARGFVARRHGGDWQVTLLVAPDTVRSEVLGVAATRSGAVAAASVSGTLLVLHSCSAGPDRASTRPRLRLRVSDLRKRRTTPVEEDLGVAPANTGLAKDIARRSAAKRLPAPVAPSGFRVRDMAGPSGLAQSTRTYRGFAADFDRDGRRDLFIGRHGLRPRLALNGPDGFRDAPGAAFSDLDRHGCDSADVDRDGERDILCALGAAQGKAVKRHELSLSPTAPAARLARDALGITDPVGRGRSVTLLRLDGDPYPEAFIANAPDREDGLPGYNRFYRNVAGRFVPAPGVGLDTSHGGECAVGTDIDDDGDEDLAYCTSFGFDGRAPGVRIMRNEGGTLRDRTVAMGVTPIADIDLAFADVTGDGRRDLIQLSHAMLRVSRRTANGYRVVAQARIDKAIAVAAGDVDGDGRADIYVARGGHASNGRDLLLLSRRAGRRLVPVRIPQTTKGTADDVIAIDYDGNGRMDFVVLNGRRAAGPIQLLATFPD